MKLSQKKQAAAYAAIHRTLVDLRISLKLMPSQDVELAQAEHVLWARIREALGVEA